MIITALLGWAPSSEAKRVMEIPLLQFSSSHGGAMQDKTCGANNMLSASHYDVAPGSDNGVKLAFHGWNISFKNLSNVGQTVKVFVLPGTKVRNQHSRGATAGITMGVTDRIAREITEEKTLSVYVPPNGTAEQGVNFTSGSEVGAIGPIDTGPDCDVQPGHRCMSQTSYLNVRLEVEEDRGAISANLTAGGHRCYGMTDFFGTPPFVYQINGGKPF